jgi:threonine dehydratase
MAIRTAPTLADIEAARRRLEGSVRTTPVFSSDTIGRRVGRPVFLKAENLQRTGSFKVRGALNKIAGLSPEERAAGVVASSAGNHGQAVAWAARETGIRATVFMPLETPMAKVEATRSYGAEVVLGGEVWDDAHARALERAEAGATLVHPFDDEDVIAGQGTVGLELAEQVAGLETVVLAIGGGGLAAGVALALEELRPDVKVVGVQSEAFATFAGLEPSGHTIAEGMAAKKPGELTRAILRDRLDDLVIVSDDEIAEAIVVLLERAKLVVEGAGAAPVAALLSGKVDGSGDACALLSGGNIDPTLLIQVARHALTRSGRFLVIRTRLSDRPGELARLLGSIAGERVNVVSVEHHREGMDLPLAEAEVELTLATKHEQHCGEVLERMREWGYSVERVR